MTEIILPPSPQPASSKLKPGVGWYLAGGAIVGASIIGAGMLFFVSLFDFMGAFDDFDRVSLTDPTEVELQAGDQVVYLVGEDTGQGTDFTAEDLQIFDPEGEALPVLTLFDSALPTSEDVYTPRLQFSALEDGTYRFEPGPDADRDLRIDSLAVGEDAEGLVSDLGTPILISISIGLVGTTIGTVLLIVTGVRRRGAKRRLAVPHGYPMGQPAQGPYGSPPPQPPPQPGWGAPPSGPPAGEPPPAPTPVETPPEPTAPGPDTGWTTPPPSGGHKSF